MEIYVITSGDYSDYSIDGVFTNREAADENCLLLNLSHNSFSPGDDEDYHRVEAWEADTVNRAFLIYTVTYDRDLAEYQRTGKEVIRLQRQPFQLAGATLPPVLIQERDGEVVGTAHGKSYEAAEKTLWDEIARFKAVQSGV